MQPGYLVCGFPLVAFLLDILLSLSWYPVYFRYGLPLLWRTWPLLTTKTLAECIPDLERDYLHDMRPIIEFRSLGRDECAFQEKVIAPRGGLRYLHIMHGYLYVEATTQQLVLIGFAKWYIVAGLLLLLPTIIMAFVNGLSSSAFSPGLTDFLTLIPVTIIVLVCYGIQVWRYYHVGKVAASLLSQTT